MIKKFFKNFVYIAFIILSITVLNSCRVEKKSEEVLYRPITSSLNYESLEDYKEHLTAKFDKVEQSEIEGNMNLSLTNYLSKYEMKNIDFLSTMEEENVEKNISISFDCENIIFVATISYSVDGNIIKQEQIESNPYYSEEKNDYFIYVDGEEISLSKTIGESNFDMCIAIVDDAAYLTVIAVVAVVIVARPVIEKVVSEFVTVVTEWFTSFWNWLKGKITRKVTYQPVYKDEIKYEVRYNNYTYNLVETDVRVKTVNEKKYYLCVVSTDEHKLYMSPIPLPDKLVAPVLATSKYITSLSKTENSYCLSTYTKENKDAYNAALASSRLIDLNYATFHSKYASNGSIKSGLQFDHYHPGYENSRCSHAHSLFGIPTLKV